MRIEKASCREDIAERFDAETSKKARSSAAWGYLFFFVPLIMHPESKFARFHSNQGFLLMLWMTAGLYLLAMIPYAGPFLMIAGAMVGLIFGIRGVITALRGQAKIMPLLGKPILLEYEQFFDLQL